MIQASEVVHRQRRLNAEGEGTLRPSRLFINLIDARVLERPGPRFERKGRVNSAAGRIPHRYGFGDDLQDAVSNEALNSLPHDLVDTSAEAAVNHPFRIEVSLPVVQVSRLNTGSIETRSPFNIIAFDL